MKAASGCALPGDSHWLALPAVPRVAFCFLFEALESLLDLTRFECWILESLSGSTCLGLDWEFDLCGDTGKRATCEFISLIYTGCGHPDCKIRYPTTVSDRNKAPPAFDSPTRVPHERRISRSHWAVSPKSLAEI
eukprot:1205413-Prymnesium_polylepis.1